MPKSSATEMQDGSSTTRGLAWIALVILGGGLFLPLATFVVLIALAGVPRASATTITMAVGAGFAWLLALVLAVVGWRHAAGKIAAIGGVILGVLATVVVWSQQSERASELDGTWQAVRYEHFNGQSDNVTASAMRLTIAGEKFKHSGILVNLRLDVDGFITTDRTQNPKTFEVGAFRDYGDAGNVSLDWSGIYEIEGDTLKLCFREHKGERPKEFKSNPAVLVVLRRVGH
jgi:uncharacterized protein (TIGR03067 family)